MPGAGADSTEARDGVPSELVGTLEDELAPDAKSRLAACAERDADAPLPCDVDIDDNVAHSRHRAWRRQVDRAAVPPREPWNRVRRERPPHGIRFQKLGVEPLERVGAVHAGHGGPIEGAQDDGFARAPRPLSPKRRICRVAPMFRQIEARRAMSPLANGPVPSA